MKIRSDSGSRKPTLNSFLFVCFYFFYFLLISACSLFLGRHSIARVTPPPALINSAAGYFSFLIERGDSIARGRAFFLLAPGKGRIEILDPIGRLVFMALWSEKVGYLAVPAEKAYWSGYQDSSELMARLIELPLDPVEILVWIVGQGEGLEPLAGGINLSWAINFDDSQKLRPQVIMSTTPDWQVEWNEAGKLRCGQRNGLKIEIQEYFKDKGVARVLRFTHPRSSGRLTVLGLEFNQTISPVNFKPDFILEKGYRAISWEDMKSLLKLD